MTSKFPSRKEKRTSKLKMQMMRKNRMILHR